MIISIYIYIYIYICVYIHIYIYIHAYIYIYSADCTKSTCSHLPPCLTCDQGIHQVHHVVREGVCSCRFVVCAHILDGLAFTLVVDEIHPPGEYPICCGVELICGIKHVGCQLRQHRCIESSLPKHSYQLSFCWCLQYQNSPQHAADCWPCWPPCDAGSSLDSTSCCMHPNCSNCQ